MKQKSKRWVLISLKSGKQSSKRSRLLFDLAGAKETVAYHLAAVLLVILGCSWEHVSAQEQSRQTERSTPTTQTDIDGPDGFAGMPTQLDSQDNPPWAISNVSLVDVQNGRVLPAQTVVIEGERILAVRDTTPEDAKTSFDANGSFMIPSLIDCHVHWNQPVRDGLLFASFGVGYVRDMGGTNLQRLRLRERAEKGQLSGVRCVVTGAIIDGVDPYHPAISIVCDTPEQGREVVRKQKEAGVNFIKAYSRLKPDVFLAICDEAQQLGIPVVGHVPESVTVLDAAKAGMQSNEHLSRIESIIESAVPTEKRPAPIPGSSMANTWWKLYRTVDSSAIDEQIKEVAKTGMVQCPTLVLIAGYGRIPPGPQTLEVWKRFASEDEFKSWTTKPEQWSQYVDESAENWPKMLDFVGKLDRQGVPIVAGTDLANPCTIAGYSLHQELYYLSLAGLSPQTVLASATTNAAKLLDIEADYGSIAPGKSASFVLLKKNPLEDVRNTLTIDTVVLRGVRMDREKLDAMQKDAELFRNFSTPGTVTQSKDQPPGELISKDRYDHFFQEYNVGEERRYLYKTPQGWTAKTLNLQSSWGSVPVELVQEFDEAGVLASAQWRVFALTPYSGKILRLSPTQYEYVLTKGNIHINQTVDVPDGGVLEFPIGSSADPMRWQKLIGKGMIPTVALTFDGEPESYGSLSIELGAASEEQNRTLIIRKTGNQEVINSVTIDSKDRLIQESSVQGSLKRSLKLQVTPNTDTPQ